ncbi:small fragment nuclease [Paramormyrops kingsleyae]|uniref:Oligoribonuclease, mitochondrial n=1 Tax=Paramormyrops kingsleyae TaxID=1676925 RepID=A0A3B3R772_9TELE|nr:oligoribonuclease, mitochondrial [Paramormyrops kingsleyae]
MPAYIGTAAWLVRARLGRGVTAFSAFPWLSVGRTRPFQTGAWCLPSVSLVPSKTATPRPSALENSSTIRMNMTASSAVLSEDMTQRLVWVDLEMTGLDIEKDKIIEMACIITDSDMNVLAEGPNLIINQSDELLDSMSDWCKEHHGKSGLTQAVRDSKISLQQAEYEFLSFVRQHTPPGHCPLAGNSVHADKKFLDKYMPQFMHHLHYRIIDVSTIKELCRRWFPIEYKLAPQKKASHRALDDIQESIKELQYYKANVFKTETEEKKHKIIENGEKKSVS